MPLLPRLGLGCAALGLSDVPDAAAQATFEAALAGGIAYFDTSPLYGAGLSERRLGRALAASGVKPFVSSKVGYHINFAEGGRQLPAERVQDFSAAFVRRSLEASLGRLGLDCIDLVYLHDPGDPAVCAEAVTVLNNMRAQKLIGAIGVGCNSCERAQAMIRSYELDAVLIAGRYTLLDRAAEAGLFASARKQQVALVVGGIFNSGILAAADPQTGRFDYAPASAEIRARAVRLAEAARRQGVSLKAAALHFVADDPAVASTLLGAASAAELVECLDLLATPITPGVLQQIAATA